MATTTTPDLQAKGPKLNRLGLPQSDYRGAPSTLCPGCGHDAITSQIVKACWEMGIEPTSAAKMSGIGCSSKTTAYFLGQSHGFNGVHGRMSAIATGSFMANHKLVHIGVSGDGDTASIGFGNFLHMVRRNLPIVYIIENNGVYALTKGQISATADMGSVNKNGSVNEMSPIDCCELAIAMGCDYVARSFSGDVNQVCSLIKGALAHRGTAVIDIVSPCMTFNNHEGSTKSLVYAKANEDPLHEIDFIPHFEDNKAAYKAGEAIPIGLPDGSRIILKKLARNYDPYDRGAALALLEKARRERLLITGLLYHGTSGIPLDVQLNLPDQPLATLPESMIRPNADALKALMKDYQ